MVLLRSAFAALAVAILPAGMAFADGAASLLKAVPNVEALRALDRARLAPARDGAEAPVHLYLSGYHAPNDGGGGILYADFADRDTPDNGGSVFVTGDGVRVKRVERDQVSLRQFGLRGDGTPEGGRFSEVLEYAVANSLAILAEEGDYNCEGFAAERTDGAHPITHGRFTNHVVNGALVLKGVGDRAKTVFRDGAGRFLLKGDLELRNVTFEGWTFSQRRYLFQIDNDEVEPGPASTRRVVVENCAFHRLPAAVGKRSPNPVTLDYVKVTGSEFRHLDGGVLLSTVIRYADVSHNVFRDFDTPAGMETGTSAVVLSGNATRSETFNLHVKDNHFENIVGRARDENHAVLAYGTHIQITGNTVNGVYAWVEDPDNPGAFIKGGADDTEAIYTKGDQVTIANNTVIDGGLEGFGQGAPDAAITFKGGGHDNVITGNIVKHPGGRGRALFVHGTATVSGNVLEGRAIFYVIPNHEEPEHKDFVFNGNHISGSVFLSGWQGRRPRNFIVSNNIIASPEGSRRSIHVRDPENVIIEGNLIYAHGAAFSLQGARGTVRIAGNTAYTNDSNPFISVGTPRILSFENNDIQPHLEQGGEPEDAGITHRLNALERLAFRNNNIRLSGRRVNDRLELRCDGVLHFTGNNVEYMGPTRFGASPLILMRTGSRNAVDLVEMRSNVFGRVSGTFLGFSRNPRILRLSVSENRFDQLNRLFQTTGARVGTAEVCGNAFAGGLDRMTAGSRGAPEFGAYTRFLASDNDGWPVEARGVAEGVATGACVAHGLPGLIPQWVQLTPLDSAAADFRVERRTSSSFDIAFGGGEPRNFAWEARWLPPEPTAPTAPSLLGPVGGQVVAGPVVLRVADEADNVAHRVQVSSSDSFASRNLVVDRTWFGQQVDGEVHFDLTGHAEVGLGMWHWRVQPLAGAAGEFTEAGAFLIEQQ